MTEVNRMPAPCDVCGSDEWHVEGSPLCLDQARANEIDAAEQRGAARERAKNYAAERQVRQELWSFIRLHAGKSDLQAASIEWLDAWAPELVSGRYADIEAGKHLEPQHTCNADQPPAYCDACLENSNE